MTESNIIFGLTLEDYSVPRFKSNVSLYGGNREEINRFIENLSQKQWTRERYDQIIQAVKGADKKNNLTYHLCGADYPAYQPMQILYSQEDFLKKHNWGCSTYDGSIYWFYAAQIIVSYIIAKGAEDIYRFIRVRFTDLQVNLQGHGWVRLKDKMEGFPCVYSYENGQHVMNLYICDKTYGEYDENKAIRELKNQQEIDLSKVTQDLIAEGISGWQ